MSDDCLITDKFICINIMVEYNFMFQRRCWTCNGTGMRNQLHHHEHHHHHHENHHHHHGHHDFDDRCPFCHGSGSTKYENFYYQLFISIRIIPVYYQFHQYFSYIMVVFLEEWTQVLGENHWPATSNWHTSIIQKKPLACIK